jgi:hypothetical protein
MSYRGMMDGWHGDEDECYGECGICSECNDNYYRDMDDAHDSFILEELQ